LKDANSALPCSTGSGHSPRSQRRSASAAGPTQLHTLFDTHCQDTSAELFCKSAALGPGC
jgi:hypothetical protein